MDLNGIFVYRVGFSNVEDLLSFEAHPSLHQDLKLGKTTQDLHAVRNRRRVLWASRWK